MKKYKSLDLLKFICAIFIACIYHYYVDFGAREIFKDIPLIREIASHGWMLVELFFIISGFLFFMSYFDVIKTKKVKFSEFILKRYVRLIPLAAISSIIMFILQQYHNFSFKEFWIWGNNDIINLIFQATGVQSWMKIGSLSLNNSIWYISVLLACYILYYFVSKLAIKKKNNLIFLIPIITSLVIYTHKLNIPFFNYNLIRGYISFGVGIILGIIIKNTPNLKKLSIISIFSIIITFALLAVFGHGVVGGSIFQEPNKYLLLLTFIIYPSLLVILIRFEFIFNFISDKLTRFLGNLSFGIYLFNLPIQLLTVIINRTFNLNINYNSILTFIIQIIIHILVAVITTTIIDKKVISKLLKKIKNIKKIIMTT